MAWLLAVIWLVLVWPYVVARRVGEQRGWPVWRAVLVGLAATALWWLVGSALNALTS